MKRLYLIGGPMGVGKTAVCKQLKSRLERSVMLDGDWCWDMQPFAVTPETKAMVMDNITHLLGNFLRCTQIDHMIFCWVMHEQAIIHDLLSRLALDDVDVLSISLICSPDVLSARLQGDIDAGLRTPDVIPRSLDRLSLYARLNTQKIDATNLPVSQTIQAILSL